MGNFRWIAAPPIQPGELFESWFVRFARANHCETEWLCHQFEMLESVQRGLAPPPSALQTIQRVAGISPERLLEAHLNTFADYSGQLCGSQFCFPHLGLNASHVVHKVCGQCLTADRIPFIRLSWALEITVACPIHRTLLSSRCAHCKRPMRFQLEGRNRPVTVCAYCNNMIYSDLASVQVSGDTVAVQELLSSLRRDTARDLPGVGPVRARVLVSSVQQLFLRLARFPLRSVLPVTDPDDGVNSLGLLEDLFDVDHRRCNALALCGWAVRDPLGCLESLQQRLRDPATFDATRSLPTLVQALQQTVRAFRTGARSPSLENGETH